MNLLKKNVFQMNYSDTQLAMKFVATNLQELENGAQLFIESYIFDFWDRACLESGLSCYSVTCVYNQINQHEVVGRLCVCVCVNI